MLETAQALKQVAQVGEGSQLRTALASKRDMLDRLFTSGDFSHLGAPNLVQGTDPLEDLLKLVDND